MANHAVTDMVLYITIHVNTQLLYSVKYLKMLMASVFLSLGTDQQLGYRKREQRGRRRESINPTIYSVSGLAGLYCRGGAVRIH
jgi:hypothetical protein